MIKANHADFANKVLEEVINLIETNSDWDCHSSNLFDDFTYARLNREADKIIDPGMKLAVKSLIELNATRDVDLSISLFDRAVAVVNYDSTWVNMIDQLKVRGFFRKSIEIANRAIEVQRSLDVIENAAAMALLTNDLLLLRKVCDVAGIMDAAFQEKRRYLMRAFSYTPSAIALNEKLGVDPKKQSNAIADIIDFVVSKNYKVSGVRIFSDICYDSLPVNIFVNTDSVEALLGLNVEVSDFIIAHEFDYLRMSIVVTGGQ